uniref:Uncharacterized protein n=1 Tax=Siphoviridae sp. ctf8W5 TaxID=2825595 RepID=A0A8S5Q935_9CAUD|nr:MAG TPA: hypothetical protein [Siphoviridae sp. ctf8W5]
MREPRPGLPADKKIPRRLAPAGLYIINYGGVCGSPRHAGDAPRA